MKIKLEKNILNKQDSFSFSKENTEKAKHIIAKYPTGKQQSAILPLLDIAQRQNDNWLSVAAIEYVANLLEMPYMRAYEVASFYSMFNLKPVGKYHIQLCGTTPCWLAGAEKIKKTCEKYSDAKTGGDNSEDNMFTITEVECLGACRNAPIAQINDDFYEDLTEEKVKNIIEDLKKNK